MRIITTSESMLVKVCGFKLEICLFIQVGSLITFITFNALIFNVIDSDSLPESLRLCPTVFTTENTDLGLKFIFSRPTLKAVLLKFKYF